MAIIDLIQKHELFFFYCFIIHMCIQGLGHFAPPPPLPPQYPAETILTLFLILL
jgi:hypothetical protein